jgi:DNA-binding MarR family transcriptional regulator
VSDHSDLHRSDPHGRPATASPVFPDDELRRLLQQLIQSGGLLEPNPEPHDHGGVQLSTSEVFALGELIETGAISQQELGARLGLEKSTVSRLAAHLETRGWLVRERDPANRRVYRLELTDQGRTTAHQVGDDLRSHHAQFLAALTPDERSGLTIGLTGLIRVLEAHRRQHQHTKHQHPETLP